MPATVIVGLQWGDEGKGKTTDFLAENVAMVVRYQGGDNAGHTVVAALYHHFYRELVQRCIRPIVESRAPGLFARYLSTLHLAVPAMDAAFLTADPIVFPAGVTKTVEECLTAAWGAVEARLGATRARGAGATSTG